MAMDRSDRMSFHSLEKKGSSGSFSNRREFRKMDSTSSNASDALDFLADMCVEIDDIEMTLSASPELPSGVQNKQGLPPNPLNGRGDSPKLRKDGSFSRRGSSGAVPIHSLSSTPAPALQPIPLKLIHLGEKNVHIIPTNPDDTEALLAACKGLSKDEGAGRALTITLEEGDSAQLASLVISQQALAQRPSPIKLINPKHIYKTSCDTYRVQMSKGSKTNPNGKFSRNARTETDALWLCEFALILIDRPNGFEDILNNGNYKCMLQRGIVRSPEDFANKLGEHLFDLGSRDLLKNHEVERLHVLLQKHIPQYQYDTIPQDALGIIQPRLPHSDMNFSGLGTHVKRELQSQPSFLHDLHQQMQMQTAAIQQHQQGTIQGLSQGNQQPYNQQDTSSSNNFIGKARGSLNGIGSLLTGPWGSFSDRERKKRRRVPSQPTTLAVPQGRQYSQQHQQNSPHDIPQQQQYHQQGMQYPDIATLTSQFVKNRSESRTISYPEQSTPSDIRGNADI
eukprot:CAMPEP_0185018032 /NCGR_PEP_ID=MMETSP1103-20130426/885_1 /TAXON_ID=36769 /ORGANISM="Paraphysomonas bandaiensis, Strain Caron Lab Isolate" /LENGTH=507 /DNA_ID=CAMNT_0027547709 /DNA_START=202 /DNA_END=1725 /DNA_ORIENTATION=-